MPSSGLLQFEAPGALFEGIVIRSRPWFYAIVLCEGEDDERVFKSIAGKLGLHPTRTIGVAHAGGIGTLPKLASAVAVLVKLMRRARVLAVILDAEELDPERRAQDLADSIRGMGLEASTPEPVEGCSQVYRLRVNNIDLYVAVSGVPEYGSLEKHKIEDHGLKLRILEGKLDPAIVESIRDSKQAVTLEEMLSDIMEASPENVKRAYPHIACLIELLQERQA